MAGPAVGAVVALLLAWAVRRRPDALVRRLTTTRLRPLLVAP